MVLVNSVRSISPARFSWICPTGYSQDKGSLIFSIKPNHHRIQQARLLQQSTYPKYSVMSRLKTNWGNHRDEFEPPTNSNFGCWERDSFAKLSDCHGKTTIDEVPPLLMPSLLKLRAEITPDDIAMSVFRNGDWQTTTYSEYYENTRTVAKAFIELGLDPFCSVNPIGFNSPEHYIAFQAAPMAGGFMAGIYPTNRYIQHLSKSYFIKIS